MISRPSRRSDLTTARAPRLGVGGRTIVLLAMAGCLAGCITTKGPPLPLAPSVDLSRMYGGWYIIAAIPKGGFEDGMVAPYDVYSPRPDGDIREDFYVRKGSFNAPRKHLVARNSVKPGTNNAYWRAIWPLNLPFPIVYVDPDYRYVLYGEQGRDMAWIYARQPVVPDADYRALLARFDAIGFDSSKFLKFIQYPDDIGKPGYRSKGIER
jgi:apolipoprotein D and lipocalin family protein